MNLSKGVTENMNKHEQNTSKSQHSSEKEIINFYTGKYKNLLNKIFILFY